MGCGIGSALLALWMLLRFPTLGPKGFVGSMVACGAATILTSVIAPAMRLVISAAGPAAAMLLVAVPILTYAFWSGGVLLRVLATLRSAFR